MGGKDDGDLLDHVIKYMAKREGIDKTLKIIRYGSRFGGALCAQGSELQTRLAALDSSLGTSRKAFRLLKFLQDYNSWRKSSATGPLLAVEALAYGGEGLYYFIEQLVWLMKAGALPKTHEKRLARVSAWAELVGYAASVYLSVLKLQQLHAKEEALTRLVERHSKEECRPLPPATQRELSSVKFQKGLRMALIVQDLADAALAVNDVMGGTHPVLNHPLTLASAGLLSAFISSYKNWNA